MYCCKELVFQISHLRQKMQTGPKTDKSNGKMRKPPLMNSRSAAVSICGNCVTTATQLGLSLESLAMFLDVLQHAGNSSASSKALGWLMVISTAYEPLVSGPSPVERSMCVLLWSSCQLSHTVATGPVHHHPCSPLSFSLAFGGVCCCSTVQPNYTMAENKPFMFGLCRWTVLL